MPIARTAASIKVAYLTAPYNAFKTTPETTFATFAFPLRASSHSAVELLLMQHFLS